MVKFEIAYPTLFVLVFIYFCMFVYCTDKVIDFFKNKKKNKLR